MALEASSTVKCVVAHKNFTAIAQALQGIPYPLYFLGVMLIAAHNVTTPSLRFISIQCLIYLIISDDLSHVRQGFIEGNIFNPLSYVKFTLLG